MLTSGSRNAPTRLPINRFRSPTLSVAVIKLLAAVLPLIASTNSPNVVGDAGFEFTSTEINRSVTVTRGGATPPKLTRLIATSIPAPAGPACFAVNLTSTDVPIVRFVVIAAAFAPPVTIGE